MSFTEGEKDEIMKKINDPTYFSKASKQVFEETDINEDGFIEKKELYQSLYNLAIQLNMDPPTRNEIDSKMETYDTNGDGKLSREEFGPIAKQILIDILTAENLNKKAEEVEVVEEEDENEEQEN